jgi:hypothetical protein
MILLILGFGVQRAWGCADPGCEPNWSLDDQDSCNNLPMLTPRNDTRVNLSLLLADTGLVKLQCMTARAENPSLNEHYGKVPFPVENFFDDILLVPDQANDHTLETKEVPARIYVYIPDIGNEIACANIQAATTEFIDAIGRNRTLTDYERQRLITKRRKLVDEWLAPYHFTANKRVPAPEDPFPSGEESTDGGSQTYQEFSHYLDAAASFYKELYGDASNDFAALTDCSDLWVRETSRYMVVRAELRRSQVYAFNEHGFYDRNKVDKEMVQVAADKLGSYLKEYPSGRYAASAKGLLRRVHWLSGDMQSLAEEYGALLHDPITLQNKKSLSRFYDELDDKLLCFSGTSNLKMPLFLAINDLFRMRGYFGVHIDLKELQAQELLFSGDKALYTYLLGAHAFYMQKDMSLALSHLSGDIPERMTYLDFSRLFLRGLALEKSKDYDGARSLWLKLSTAARQPLQSEAVQLALSQNYERSRELMDKAFAPDSPIKDPTIRIRLLRDVASPSLLRRVINEKSTSAREREFALYILLNKDLLQGHYKEYIRDYLLLPKDLPAYTRSNKYDYGQPDLSLFKWSGEKTNYRTECVSTLNIAARLTKNLRDPLALISLVNFTDDYHCFLIPLTNNSQFPGDVFSGYDACKIIISDKTAPPEMKAYALYRVIKSYAGMGRYGADEPLSVRREWFRLLKSKYKDSVWAKKLKYFW